VDPALDFLALVLRVGDQRERALGGQLVRKDDRLLVEPLGADGRQVSHQAGFIRRREREQHRSARSGEPGEGRGPDCSFHRGLLAHAVFHRGEWADASPV